ncbi:MAG: hypothetical protein ABJO88_15190 [Parasphingorhabdus sp.]
MEECSGQAVLSRNKKLAKDYGVSQKGLLFAFARHSINQIESPTYGIGLGMHL